MIDDILFALWFFLPAGMANVTPVILAKAPVLKHWNAPIDMGRSWRGKRIFGDHKTWRGLATGIIAGTLVLWLQVALFESGGWVQAFSPLNYSEVSILGLGILLSFGALSGDAGKSFFKRRANVPSGRSWFPFDQLDYIAGGLLLSTLVVQLSFAEYAWIVLIWFGLHLISSYLGYLLKFKDHPI